MIAELPTLAKKRMFLVSASDEDIEFGRRVHHASYREMVVRQFGEWDESVQDGFFERTWSSHRHHIIFDNESERCGYCAIERGRDEIILREIAILPERQGMGIGSQVIRDLISEANELCITVRLNVMKSNTRARRLYEHLGFRQIGENDTHFLMERRCVNQSG